MILNGVQPPASARETVQQFNRLQATALIGG